MLGKRIGNFVRLVADNGLLVVAGSLVCAWRLLVLQTASEELALFPASMSLANQTPFGFSGIFGLSSVSAALACVVLLLVVRANVRIVGNAVCYVAGFALAVVALALDTFPVAALSPMVPLAAICILGLSDGLLYPIYVLNHTSLRPLDIVFLIAFESLVGAVVNVVLDAFLTDFGFFVATAALIVLSGMLLYRHGRAMRSTALKEGFSRSAVSPAVMPFASFCALVLCFAVTRGSFQSLTIAESGVLGSGGAAIALSHAALLVALLFVSVRGMQALLLSTVVVMVGGIVLIPLYSADNYLALMIHLFGFSAFVVVRWGFVPFYSTQESGRSPAMTVCMLALCNHVGKVAGSVGVELLHKGGELSLSFVAMALLAMLVLVILFVLLRQQRSWREAAESADARPDARLDQACLLVTTRCELTAREAEVLRLVAEGKTPLQIEQSLFISRNTVKSHLKHIYAKTGTHSREELGALVERTTQELL
ncbi:MAG: helix-turn-helix transcriptional regulator [Adlercreutzia sp.]|nr:helix-turn-helix transcriptional regulator [Adlercreutzia sp.]